MNSTIKTMLLPDSPLDLATKNDVAAMQQLVQVMESCYNEGRSDEKKIMETRIAQITEETGIQFTKGDTQ